jgi:hypothetical protein
MVTRVLAFLVIALLMVNTSLAQSPREQMQQMVEQLQKSSNDNVLRERIIKLAPTLKPPPALPDAAVSFEGRAQFAFRSAKSEDDFLAAAREYEKAVAVAPWVLGYYSDLCTIYEKAGKLEDAKRHCGFYLIGLTDPAQVTDVKRHIAGLEFGIEKANSPQTAKVTNPAGPDFSGCWQGGDFAGTQYCELSFERNGDSWLVRNSNKKPLTTVRAQGRQLSFVDDDPLGSGWLTSHWELVLSEDGKTIDGTWKDTQSADQFNRMQRDSPGSRLPDLNRINRHSTFRRK